MMVDRALNHFAHGSLLADKQHRIVDRAMQVHEALGDVLSF